MAKFRLTEKENEYEPYIEEFDTREEAQTRMRGMYHQVAIEGNPNVIYKAKIYENSAIVITNEDMTIEWDIEEIP